jgi:hypothetical protein
MRAETLIKIAAAVVFWGWLASLIIREWWT